MSSDEDDVFKPLPGAALTYPSLSSAPGSGARGPARGHLPVEVVISHGSRVQSLVEQHPVAALSMQSGKETLLHLKVGL